MLGFWRLLYNPNPLPEEANEYYLTPGDKKYGWAKNIYEAPETLLFWIDFLDTEADIDAFSISAIGSRPKVNNDKDVKAIKYRDTPNIIFYYPQEQEVLKDTKTGYSYVQL
jgi:hypothetical protein